VTQIAKVLKTKDALEVLSVGSVIVDALGDVYEIRHDGALLKPGWSGFFGIDEAATPVKVLLEGDER